MALRRLKSLVPRIRALTVIAVLLDGREAAEYLGYDSVQGDGMRRSADELSALPLEIRMPVMGTTLRTALKEITSGLKE
ncbi:MAG: hypothetical protein R3A13_08455 [Bdellovibrionota bacterium]